MLAQIPPPPFSGFELGPFDLRMYGLLIAVGAFLALTMVVKRYERFGGAPEVAERAALLALLGGLIGSRIGYIIPRFLQDGAHGAAYISRPLEILAIWQGGLAFFGGLVGGALAVIVYVRVKGGDIPAMADAVAPALPLAQAIGRWGNYFNEELFGRPTDVPWALQVDQIPVRIAERYPGATTFHPTFLYESLWNLALVGLILLADRLRWFKRRGSLMFLYLIGYGVGRGWVETLRVDTFERYLGLSRNNWVAIATVLIGVAGLVLWERRGSGALIDETQPVEDGAAGTEGDEPPAGATDDGEVAASDTASDADRDGSEREPGDN